MRALGFTPVQDHNSRMNPYYTNVGVVGAGAMGRGIAQIAVQGGSQFRLFDMNGLAAQSALEQLESLWQRMCEKERSGADSVQIYKSRLTIAHQLRDLADCDLVIEAVVERIDIKAQFFSDLEGLVKPSTVLATNTSSLSVTAIAAHLQHPARLAGFHFFNPVPLMKVVEIVRGIKTDSAVVDGLTQYARQIEHTPVVAQDTPGFIVNHTGRGYGTEALRLVSDGCYRFRNRRQNFA
jgi:3-hydroxybutyryl-CoA dehydrogenase